MLWLSIAEGSTTVLVAIGVLFPVYATLSSALSHVDPHLVEAGKAYGLRGVALLTRIQLPSAAPAVVAGLRLGLAQGRRSARPPTRCSAWPNAAHRAGMGERCPGPLTRVRLTPGSARRPP
ncbi:ABC transporter permease [Nonomuraea jabiensis]|uniref:ABC transmembrane type-1 domain-containing protein n=1 Tax=Nonomuraea jabiensis TaxID=882448 RepID=A0A7W9LG01_9ACTN|nr:ABC transporter permease subunit [Nonomuraea jabiensis]MBB5782427.1 hypothetical protein [Nonomuraea jabiensis]